MIRIVSSNLKFRRTDSNYKQSSFLNIDFISKVRVKKESQDKEKWGPSRGTTGKNTPMARFVNLLIMRININNSIFTDIMESKLIFSNLDI